MKFVPNSGAAVPRAESFKKVIEVHIRKNVEDGEVLNPYHVQTSKDVMEALESGRTFWADGGGSYLFARIDGISGQIIGGYLMEIVKP